MKKGRKNLIKKLHSVVGIVWQTSIEKEFPKLFKEDALVVGKWYKSKESKSALLCFQPKGNHFGFNNVGTWTTIYNLVKSEMIPATDKEVEQALIKEAKKRGFKEGCVIKHNQEAHPSLDDNEIILNDDFYFDITENFLTIYGWEIFTDGKWATIVETITKEQFEEAKEVLAQYHKQ